MNYVVFDTETTSLNKPFCYNIGYTIVSDCGETLLSKDFVVEQVWHNLPLFSTAYYAEKRPIYVLAMRQHKTIMDKFGYICRTMARDFQTYNVEVAYAYNSSFDDGVFSFNCDWFKCNNPFENIPIYDIRGNVCQYLINDEYKLWCEKHEAYTESGAYSSTAENVYRFITRQDNWNEDHTALSDALIENEILRHTLTLGAELGTEYKASRTLGSPHIEKVLHIKSVEQTDYYFPYEKIRINKEKTEITLK